MVHGLWSSRLRQVILLATLVGTCILIASHQIHSSIKHTVAPWALATMIANFSAQGSASSDPAEVLGSARAALAERIRNIRERQQDLYPHTVRSALSYNSASHVVTPRQQAVVRTTTVFRPPPKRWSYLLTCDNGIKINCTYPPLSTHRVLQDSDSDNLAHLPSNTRLLIISPGGVGTTFLMRQLYRVAVRAGKLINNEDDNDGLKHMLFDERALCRLQCFRPSAILYVFDNPASVIHSHIRRQWAVPQYLKLNGLPPPLDNATNDALHWLLDTAANYTKKVIATQQDIFGIERHMMSWVKAPINISMQFMTTQAAMQSSYELGSLLDLKPAYLEYLFSKLQNKSYDPNEYDPDYVRFYDHVFERMLHYNYYKKNASE